MNVSGPGSPITPASRLLLEPSARTTAVTASSADPQPIGARGESPAAESSLWELLTPEEREFFLRAAEMGPLTYRPGGRTTLAAALPLGQRIDLRG